ncbi:MAG: calcium-binding protein [Planctomycetota bacterium]|nr:calcium-binding protein [Planctomycetota bacterium]
MLSATPVGDLVDDVTVDSAASDTVAVAEVLQDVSTGITADTQLADIADTENPVTFLELDGTQTLPIADTVNASQDPTANQVGLAIDVNPTNPLNVVGVSHNVGTKSSVDVLSSFDGGATWSTTSIDASVDGLSAWGKRFDVATAFDADGNLYVAYGVNEGPGGSTSVVVARSQDGGASINQVSVVDVQRNLYEGKDSRPGAEGFRLATGIDPLSERQAVYVAYTQNVIEAHYGYDKVNYQEQGYGYERQADYQKEYSYRPVDERIVVAGSNNAGAGWTDPKIVNDGSLHGTDVDNGFADVAVGPEGELYVTWLDQGYPYGGYTTQSYQVDHSYQGPSSSHDYSYGSNGAYGAPIVNNSPAGYGTQYYNPQHVSPVDAYNASKGPYKPASNTYGYSVVYSHPGSIEFDVDRDGLFSTNDSFGHDETAAKINTDLQRTWASAAPKQGIHNGPVVDVDRSGGANDGRVYITFADTTQPHILTPIPHVAVTAPPAPAPVADTVDDAATTDATSSADANTNHAYKPPLHPPVYKPVHPQPVTIVPSGNVDSDVFVITSDNEGASWSDRLRVNGPATGSNEFHPWVDVDQTSGSVNVIYYSTAGDEATGNDDVHVQVATSTDGAATFPAAQSQRLTAQSSNATLNPTPVNFHNYIGVAVHDGTLHGFWADNSGNPKDFEAFTANVAYSSGGDSNLLEVSGDADGATADNFILRRSASNQQFIELLLNDDVVFAGLSASVDGIVLDGGELVDTLTVDFTNGNPIPRANGVTYNGNDPGMPADGDQLRIVGGGAAVYTPSATTNGSGTVVVDGNVIRFTGLEETLYVDGTDQVTLVTPNAEDVLNVDSAAVDKNVVSGTSGGVGFNSLTFQNVGDVSVDAASNDAVGGSADNVTVASPLVATGLQNFSVSTGAGDDTISAGPNFALPVSGGAFSINAGDGVDHLNSSGDANFTLSDAELATSGPDGGGSVALNSSVETVSLTGGASNNTIDASGFTGSTTLSGEAGDDTLTGSQGDDDIFGGTGSDVVLWNAGAGSDRIEGGAGESDQVYVTATAGGDAVMLTAASTSTPNNPTRVTVAVSNAVGSDVLDLASVENVSLALGDGADSLHVNDLAGTDVGSVDANLGADASVDSVTVEGRENSDNITVAGHGGGKVSIDGLTADINLAAVSGDAIVVNGNDGDDRLYSNNTVGVANLTLNGGLGNDQIDADASVITGGDGADVLTARGFADHVLDGGSGDDVIQGGPGVDHIDGGAGDDNLAGGAGDDMLTDLQGNNHFDGGDGNDGLFAGAGDDSFVLEAGNDSIAAGAGFDTLAITTGAGDDVVSVEQTLGSLITSVNGSSQTDSVVRGSLEEITISTGAGDDLIGIRVSDDYIAQGTPGDSSRFEVDAGESSTGDRLAILDDGPGDLSIHREDSNNHDGTVRVGGLDPVNYINVETVDILPLDPVGTGLDGDGRVLVVDTDPFEHNNDRLNSTDLAALDAAPVNPNVDPAGVVDPFGFGSDLPGDEDWYEFHASKTGTFQFELEFDAIQTLANGRDGLPGDGELVISAFDANGDLIASSHPSDNGQTVTIGVADGSTTYLRVDGLTEDVFNVYDISTSEVDTLGPRVFDPDGVGPDRHGVEITSDPTFNLFDVKPAQGPTPGVVSLTINIEDAPNRFPGFLYEAVNAGVAGNPGHYHLVGDNNGIVAIQDIVVTNNPVAEGETPTATLELIFDGPIPDDRYTLTVSDSITDPADNSLDGETNADEPNGDPAFPSGDGVSGGDFVARFTVDSRPEIATVGAGPGKGYGDEHGVYIDINGNFDFDPTSGDHSNRDLVFEFAQPDDHHFVGQFGASDATSVDGFDRLGAYGIVREQIGTTKYSKTREQYRWLLDFDNDGVADFNKVAELQLAGVPIAGDFDTSHPGDEVGLYIGKSWLLDTNQTNDIEAKGDTYLSTNMSGAPLVGDFDGDGLDDLATYLDYEGGKGIRRTQFFFDLTTADDGSLGVLDGQYDDVFEFSLAGQSSGAVPFAADFNLDGIDDLGLKERNRRAVTPEEQAEWFFLLSNAADAQDGTANALKHAFSPAPLGNDMFAQFGHHDSLPLVGNFDPPVTSAGSTTMQAPLDTGESHSDSSSNDVADVAPSPMQLQNGELKFDFDVAGSETFYGSISVQPDDVYSPSQGYGWNSAVQGNLVDRASSSDLMGDGHSGTDQTFHVDVPNGVYEVLVVIGDDVARDGTQVSAEGNVEIEAMSTRAGEFVGKTFNVTVVDGRLSLQVQDVSNDGAADGWNVSGIRLRQLSSTASLDLLLGGDDLDDLV